MSVPRAGDPAVWHSIRRRPLRQLVDEGFLQVTVETDARPGERTARKPAPDEIARKAFDIDVTQGGEHGHELEDWLERGV